MPDPWTAGRKGDWFSEDQPQDKLNRLYHPGQDNFGFPYCDGGEIPNPQFRWGHSCDEFTKPIAQLGPHTAPLGMRFYTGKMFPKECHNAIFITRHGLWNRSKKIGADVVVARFNPDGAVKSIEPFITGFIQGANYVGRPVDIEWLRDGSTLLSDDFTEINTALPGAGDETVTNCKKSETSPDD
jgi:glucose/arabinose dehydrogenase